MWMPVVKPIYAIHWIVIKQLITGSELEKKLLRNRLLEAGWHTKLLRFQGARPDHVRVESSCCFPGELVSFVRPRDLVSFDPRNVTRSPPVRKRT